MVNIKENLIDMKNKMCLKFVYQGIQTKGMREAIF